MATVPEKKTGPMFLDKARVKAIVDRAFAEMGFVPDPNALPHRARKMMRAQCVRPEENLFSRGVIEMREE